jgi:hypothetical protein
VIPKDKAVDFRLLTSDFLIPRKKGLWGNGVSLSQTHFPQRFLERPLEFVFNLLL